MNTSGYIYCFSNPSFNGILKIGMTTRYIERRLVEANHCGTWGPPTPYKIEFAKKVVNPLEKETILHMLLEKYSERVNANREFFRISIEDVRLFFDLIDGDYWNELDKPIEEKEVKKDIIENNHAIQCEIKIPNIIQNTLISHNNNSKYKCEICMFYTDIKQNFIIHMKSSKHKQFETNSYTNYKCSLCNKKYYTSSGLYKHKRKCKNVFKSIKNSLIKTNMENLEQILSL